MELVNFAYLGALLISITGMVVLDARFRLFFWRDARRAAIVLPLGVIFFLLWDVGGIVLGVFFRGATDFMTGVLVGPELPLEEVFFLTLLCYNTMIAYTAAGDLLDRWAARRASDGATGAAPATDAEAGR